MILLVDAGNSRIKWRVQRQGEVFAAGGLPTASRTDLPQAWSGIRVEAACVCSVAGEAVNTMIRRALDPRADMSVAVHWLLAQGEAHGVTNRYEPAESLGPDRYAALVAARRRQPRDWVVVNVGTAMTADMLTAAGQFLGGVILPGPDLMKKALKQGTAGVRPRGLYAMTRAPRNTLAAVSQGVAWALWGGVEGMKRQLAHTVGRVPRVLLSGGGRQALLPMLEGEVTEVDELVLEGLGWIARDLGYDA